MSLFVRRLITLILVLVLIGGFLLAGFRSEGPRRNYQQGLSVFLAMAAIIVLLREIFRQIGPRTLRKAEIPLPGSAKWELGDIAAHHRCTLWVIFYHSFDCFRGRLVVFTASGIIAERTFPEGISAKQKIRGYHPAFRRGPKHCTFDIPKGFEGEVTVQLTLESVRPGTDVRSDLKIGDSEPVEVVCVKRVL